MSANTGLAVEGRTLVRQLAEQRERLSLRASGLRMRIAEAKRIKQAGTHLPPWSTAISVRGLEKLLARVCDEITHIDGLLNLERRRGGA